MMINEFDKSSSKDITQKILFFFFLQIVTKFRKRFVKIVFLIFKTELCYIPQIALNLSYHPKLGIREK